MSICGINEAMGLRLKAFRPSTSMVEKDTYGTPPLWGKSSILLHSPLLVFFFYFGGGVRYSSIISIFVVFFILSLRLSPGKLMKK